MGDVMKNVRGKIDGKTVSKTLKERLDAYLQEVWDPVSDNELEGYSGTARELLENAGAGVWSIVKITTGKGIFEGIVLPRNKFAAPGSLEIKMKSGLQYWYRGR